MGVQTGTVCCVYSVTQQQREEFARRQRQQEERLEQHQQKLRQEWLKQQSYEPQQHSSKEHTTHVQPDLTKTPHHIFSLHQEPIGATSNAQTFTPNSHIHQPKEHTSSSSSLTPISMSVSGAAVPATIKWHSFPETIIDTRTATGHVMCRILSETPLEPDESGIGASDQSLGSSNVSVASGSADRASGANQQAQFSPPPPPPPTPPPPHLQYPPHSQEGLRNRTEDSQFPIPDTSLLSPSPHKLQTHQEPVRKRSLGAETSVHNDIPYIPMDMISPRRASHYDIPTSQTSSLLSENQHSSNTFLFPETSSTNNTQPISSDDKRSSDERSSKKHRKHIKSKFMQEMEKKRNHSEPGSSKGSKRSSSGSRRSTMSASDAQVANVFGPTVHRKKSIDEGDATTHSMRGYSKRFDALWARFDPKPRVKGYQDGSGDLDDGSTPHVVSLVCIVLCMV